MVGLLNISHMFLHNLKAINLKKIFHNNLNIKIINYNIFNKYVQLISSHKYQKL